MKFNKTQKEYLINLVKHDLSILEDLRNHDSKGWDKEYQLAHEVQVILCGGAK